MSPPTKRGTVVSNNPVQVVSCTYQKDKQVYPLIHVGDKSHKGPFRGHNSQEFMFKRISNSPKKSSIFRWNFKSLLFMVDWKFQQIIYRVEFQKVFWVVEI